MLTAEQILPQELRIILSDFLSRPGKMGRLLRHIERQRSDVWIRKVARGDEKVTAESMPTMRLIIEFVYDELASDVNRDLSDRQKLEQWKQ